MFFQAVSSAEEFGVAGELSMPIGGTGCLADEWLGSVMNTGHEKAM
jgi:hypothetical protein